MAVRCQKRQIATDLLKANVKLQSAKNQHCDTDGANGCKTFLPELSLIKKVMLLLIFQIEMSVMDSFSIYIKK